MSSDAERAAAYAMPAEQWSFQLRIQAGRAVEDAPQLGVAESLDRVGRLVRLAILAEPASDGAAAFIDQLVQRIVALFDPSARSLTGALRSAVETAHQELRSWNQQRLPAERAAYGLSCLIQREDGPAILAQAGPAAALLAGSAGIGGLRRMSLHQHTAQTAALGADVPLELSFTAAEPSDQHADQGQIGAWALLISSNAAALLDAERRVALSRLGASDALRELYPALLQLRDAAVLAVVMGPSETRGHPAPTSALLQPEDQSAAEMGDRSEARLFDAEAPPPAAQSQLQDDSSDQRASRPPESERRGWRSSIAELTGRAPTAPQATDWTVESAPIAALEWTIEWPANPFAQRGLAQVATLSPPIAPPAAATAPAIEPLFELAAVLPFLRERWDTPVTDPPDIAMGGGRRGRAQHGRAHTARRAGLLLASMLVVLAAVAAVLLGPALLESDADERSAQIERARNSIAASQLAPEADAARLALEDARTEVEAALEQNPLAADALQLRAEIEAGLAELSLVQAPGELNAAADLSAYGPSIALGAVVSGGASTGAFILDDAGGRVFRVTADGAAAVIFLEGELLGLDAELRAGRPVSVAWQPAAETLDQALWILDSNARLFRWTADGVLLVPVPDLPRLGSADAVAATAGSIYLLDGAGGAIWRFAVEAGGAQLAAPIVAVGRTDLLEATEFRAVVTAGGAVEFVVASADGRLRRFGSSGERALAAGLTTSLVSPASLSLGAQSGLIYVVDRAQGRLIAIGPDGNAVSLIQSAQLENLRGAQVDEASGQIIYALPDRLLSGRLPVRSEQ